MTAIFADSNRARMRYIKEGVLTWGTTPASGQTRELRYTGSTLNAQKDTTMSEEIRSDRMVPDIIETAARSSGEINTEFSAGSHDDFMEAFVYGAWTRPMTFDGVRGRAVEFTGGDTLVVRGADVTPLFEVGRRIRTQGFENPENNDYFEISAITYASPDTTITLTANTAVAEGGSAFTRLYDANDVIVLKNTSLRFGTGGENVIDSNSNNAFAAAIAAGQLVPGQKVFVEGYGFESADVTIAAPGSAAIDPGARLTVNDGEKSVTFQFGGTPSQSVTLVEIGADETETGDNLAAAVNRARVRGQLDFSASNAAGTVSLKNLNLTGGSLSKTGDTNTALTLGSFSGGDQSFRGVKTLSSVTDDVLTFQEEISEDDNSGGAAITIKGSMLRNPADADEITPQSFTFETGFEDVDQYYIADGQRVGTFSLSISANSIMTGSFGLQGRGTSRQATTKLGDDVNYTPLDTTATPVANATVNVGTIEVNGEALSTAIQSIELSGTNNLRDQNAVSYKFPAGIGAGRLEISGSLVAYFADGSLWDKFINHDTVSVNWPIIDVEGHRYEYTIPAANFSSDTVNPAGGNQDIMENLEWMAKRDPQTDCTIQVDRFSATYPVTA